MTDSLVLRHVVEVTGLLALHLMCLRVRVQEMQRYFWDYCMSQHGYFHVEKSASQCKITMEHGPFGPIPHAWAGERERAEARDAALSELMESDEVRPRLRLYLLRFVFHSSCSWCFIG